MIKSGTLPSSFVGVVGVVAIIMLLTRGTVAIALFFSHAKAAPARRHGHTSHKTNVKNSIEWFGGVENIPTRGSGAPLLKRGDIPKSHDWRNVDGIRYATGSKTQQVAKL